MPSGNGAKKKKQQEKHAKEKQQKEKGSQIEARAAALKLQCPICKSQFGHVNVVKSHYDAKHPGVPIPAELTS